MSLVAAIAAINVVPALRAAEAGAGDDRPGRGLTVAFQYSGITIEAEDNVSVDLLVRNRGRSDETVLLQVTDQPKDWEVELKKYSSIVSGVFVAAGQEQTLSLSAKPKAPDRAQETRKLPPGTYRFAVQARTEDGALTQNAAVRVTVREKPKGKERVNMDTTYPELRGPADDKFVFSLDVRNDTDQDAVFNFKATAPPGWETSFKPAYEQKQIASLQINANSSKTVELQVTPPYNAEAGEYEFRAEAASPKGKAEKDLKVVITGTHSIKAGTPTGLLSLVAEQGKKANTSLIVHNKGSAPQGEISFTAFKPENWEVKFDPEKINRLEPGAFKQVEMTLTPAAQALVGDYAVNVQVQGEKASDDVEFRVTIKASTTWGWVGAALIVIVIAGLAVAFKTLGRR
ncbi:MAG: hypothetical protein JXQ71_04945 [Verrucomicrobia bacterium]|nr:hypothetical protein [Verrucomicrobiota bacterium]